MRDVSAARVRLRQSVALRAIAMATPNRMDGKLRAWEMKERLERCWKLHLDWSLYPPHVRTVSIDLYLKVAVHGNLFLAM